MAKKHTKKALFASVMSLVLCFAMLVGTTFAWFTDTVTSANNKIVAGNLDVELHMWDGENYTDISAATSPIFGEDSIAQDNNAETLWEPGKTQVAYLAIHNAGSLALKYQVSLNVTDIANKLYEAMRYDIIEDAMNGDVTEWTSGASVTVGSQIVSDSKVSLGAGETHYFALAIHMDETAGNTYQGGKVNFDLSVLATQLNAEFDSFGNQYDEDSQYPVLEMAKKEENEPVTVGTGNVKIHVPANAPAGNYAVEVTNKNETTDAEGETTLAMDIVLKKDDVEVEADGTIMYIIEENVGACKTISTVTHNGTVLTNAKTGADQTFTYNAATGVVTIYTKSFSPFAVTYTDGVEYVMKLNRGHTQTSYISTSTGADFLPIAAVNPEITGYSVYDGDTRIANSVCFRYSMVEKQVIDENSYKVSFNLAIKDENGTDLELKPGMPSTINGKEYLNMFVNLLELPEGYAVSGVKVNEKSFALTSNAGGNPATGEYWIGSDGTGVYLQSKEAGLFEIIVAEAK